MTKTIPPDSTASAGPGALPPSETVAQGVNQIDQQMKFRFAPSMGPLFQPALDDLPEGTDAWAFAKGYVSVTPIRAEYAGLGVGGCGFGSQAGQGRIEGRIWDQ